MLLIPIFNEMFYATNDFQIKIAIILKIATKKQVKNNIDSIGMEKNSGTIF